MKEQNVPITALTAYDYPTGLAIENTHSNSDIDGIDIALIGDSLAFTCLGLDSTSSLTLDEMIHHSKAVVRAAKTPFVVTDMPFGTTSISKEDTIRSAIKLIKNSGTDAVKIEGSKKSADIIEGVVNAGVPVIGHIGLLPQRATQSSGFRVQGKTPKSALSIVEDALALQKAGAFAILIEAVPSKLGEYITNLLKIPTIGIGAGNLTSGQVLVQNDMLGIFEDFKPKFVRNFTNVNQHINFGLQSYIQSVRDRSFPSNNESYTVDPKNWEDFENLIKNYNFEDN